MTLKNQQNTSSQHFTADYCVLVFSKTKICADNWETLTREVDLGKFITVRVALWLSRLRCGISRTVRSSRGWRSWDCCSQTLHWRAALKEMSLHQMGECIYHFVVVHTLAVCMQKFIKTTWIYSQYTISNGKEGKPETIQYLKCSYTWKLLGDLFF